MLLAETIKIKLHLSVTYFCAVQKYSSTDFYSFLLVRYDLKGLHCLKVQNF
jgi:hypothetical protein